MLRALCVVALALAAAGCSGELVADIEVEQGRESYAVLADQIEPGMTAAAVRTLMGPPHSRWELDTEQWVYYFSRHSYASDTSHILRIHFDDSKVVSLDQASSGS